jgi:uroporphyrinogen decarboxylase
MHVISYANLRRYLGLPEVEIGVRDLNAQVARMDEDFLERLRVDTRFIQRASPSHKQAPGSYQTETLKLRDEGDYLAYTDEWGIGWQMPKEGGLYFDMYRHPFGVDDVQERLKTYTWPDATDPGRFEGLRERALSAHQKGKLVVLNGLCAGIVEVYSWLRGYTRYYMDLAAEPETAGLFLDMMVELKAAYWERALAEAGEYVDVVAETDDVAGQHGLLMSPETYRRLIKPRHRELFAAIKKATPHVKIYLHSCGAVRPLIPDFIEIGVDILNPVQLSAEGMDPFELKREFGKDIVFWGGGVDAQQVLGSGTPREVRDNVRRSIDVLALGGGVIFAADHIIQANVPPENVMAMWETLQE